MVKDKYLIVHYSSGGKKTDSSFFLAFLLITGIAAAQYSLEKNISIDLAQSVDGTGFFSSYRYVNMPDLLGNLQGVVGQDLSGMTAKHLAHGSGKTGENARILAYSYYYEDGVIPVQNGAELEPVIDDDNTTSFPSIHIQEDMNMVYGPFIMDLGGGYYARHPIVRASLPADRTCIKNLDAGMSLHNQIEYARAFRKELEAYADYIDLANATMTINETITSGMARVGALQLEELPSMDEDGVLSIKKSKPLIETDAMYIGSFHINKSMIFAVQDYESDEDEYEDEWLSCPCNSVLDAIIAQPDYFNGPKGFGYDVRPVFDCTCPTIPERSGPTKGLAGKHPRMLFQGTSQIRELSYNHVD